MSMKPEIIPELSYLGVRASGVFSLGEAKRTFLEMLEAVAEHKVGKVLLDGGGLVGSPDAMERFFYGEFAARAVGQSAARGILSQSTQFAYVLVEPMRDKGDSAKTLP